MLRRAAHSLSHFPILCKILLIFIFIVHCSLSFNKTIFKKIWSWSARHFPPLLLPSPPPRCRAGRSGHDQRRARCPVHAACGGGEEV